MNEVTDNCHTMTVNCGIKELKMNENCWAYFHGFCWACFLGLTLVDLENNKKQITNY